MFVPASVFNSAPKKCAVVHASKVFVCVMCLHSSCSAYLPLSVCSPICFFACVCACVCNSALPFPPGLIPEQQQHVNGGRKRQSCHRGAGGAPSSSSSLLFFFFFWSRHSRAAAPPTPHNTHPEPEPHPVSPSDTHHPVAASSRSRSHEESQSHTLQRALTHTVTVTAAEVRLPAHTQPLSHDQGREGSAGLCREAHQTHRTAVPQNSSAGKSTFIFGVSFVCGDSILML